MARRRPFRDVPLVCDTRAGPVRFALAGVPVFDRATGELTGYRGAARQVAGPSPSDGAQLVRALEEISLLLNDCRWRAQRVDAASAQRMAQWLHELRTPLNAVVSYGELGLGQTDDPRLRQYLESIVTAARHLEALVNDPPSRR